MDFLAEARRRAFSFWLRTGRLPSWAKPAAPEVKFNPWHDPDDGRFTFRGAGRYFGRSGTGGAAARSLDAGMSERPKEPKKPKEPFGGYGGGGGGFNGGGASGSWDTPDRGPWWDPTGKTPQGRAARTPERTPRATPPATSARGRVGGQSSRQDATTTAQTTPKRITATDRSSRRAAEQPSPQNSRRTGKQPSEGSQKWKRIERNGYDFYIDDRARTRRVEGRLTLNDSQSRSRSAQAQAGGTDRRGSDEGGHYIARRFNGPTEAFNHFAQDANFNRGLYRSVENQWAKALRSGRRVKVRIEPVYEGTSRRPKQINVSYWTDGLKRRVKFHNEPRERSGVKGRD